MRGPSTKAAVSDDYFEQRATWLPPAALTHFKTYRCKNCDKKAVTWHTYCCTVLGTKNTMINHQPARDYKVIASCLAVLHFYDVDVHYYIPTLLHDIRVISGWIKSNMSLSRFSYFWVISDKGEHVPGEGWGDLLITSSHWPDWLTRSNRNLHPLPGLNTSSPSSTHCLMFRASRFTSRLSQATGYKHPPSQRIKLQFWNVLTTNNIQLYTNITTLHWLHCPVF